jgi:hypothetical protein
MIAVNSLCKTSLPRDRPENSEGKGRFLAAQRIRRSAAANSASVATWAPKVGARRLPNDNWNALLDVSCSALLCGGMHVPNDVILRSLETPLVE